MLSDPATQDMIIKSLNKDHMKLWFAQDSHGQPLREGVARMTYKQVALRMIELMTYRDTHNWIHSSFEQRLVDFLSRAEARSGGGSIVEKISKHVWSSDPTAAVESIFSTLVDLADQCLAIEDVHWWIARMRGPGKPVNFIPVLDTNLKTWFKKDTLWYCEELQAVPESDVQRTFILQGPVAVRYSNIVNEPVRDILQEMNRGLCDMLPKPSEQPEERDPVGFDSQQDSETQTERQSNESAAEWCIRLAADPNMLEWQQHLLRARYVTEYSGILRKDNPLRLLLKDTELNQCGWDADILWFDGTHQERIEVSYNSSDQVQNTNTIKIIVPVGGCSLRLELLYLPSLPWAPIQEVPTVTCIAIMMLS